MSFRSSKNLEEGAEGQGPSSHACNFNPLINHETGGWEDDAAERGSRLAPRIKSLSLTSWSAFPSLLLWWVNLGLVTVPGGLLVGPIDPGDGHVLQDDHDEQRQRSGVVVEHGHEVIP